MNGALFIIFSDFEVDCRKFIDIGCLAFVIAALSSQHIATRETAYHVLARFMNQLEGSRFLEKTQVGIFIYDKRQCVYVSRGRRGRYLGNM